MNLKKIQLPKSYKIGTEIECKIPYYKFDSDPYSGTYRLREIQSLGCKLKNDSSIRCDDGDERAVEILTPPLQFKKFTETIKKVCESLSEKDARVNRSCGFHVHISNKKFSSKKNVKRIAYLWSSIEDVLFSMQPPSRYGNTYCRRFIRAYVESDLENTLPRAKQQLVRKLAGMERYNALNLSALSRHGTIECRIHSGTTDYTKILYFVIFLMYFYEYAMTRYDHKKVKELFETEIEDGKIRKAFALLKLPAEVKKFYTARISKMEWNKMKMTTKSAIELVSKQKEYMALEKRYQRVSNEYSQRRDARRNALDHL